MKRRLAANAMGAIAAIAAGASALSHSSKSCLSLRKRDLDSRSQMVTYLPTVSRDDERFLPLQVFWA